MLLIANGSREYNQVGSLSGSIERGNLLMNRSSYQSHPQVVAFIAWASTLIEGGRPFHHRWCSKGFGEWSCESVFDAYLSYEWRFSVRLPGESHLTEGRSFDQNVETLDRLKDLLRECATRSDSADFLEAAKAVVLWGGVGVGNVKRLDHLGEQALSCLRAAAEQLDPRSADTGRLSSVIDMNSGFSKIYSLLVDGLPIYDSRVACALCFLVRSFCQEKGLPTVPAELEMRLPEPRPGNPRDPSVGSLQFHKLRWGQEKEYAVSNLKAAWLLEPLAECGSFGELTPTRRLLALQSALFMIGYTTPAPDGPKS